MNNNNNNSNSNIHNNNNNNNNNNGKKAQPTEQVALFPQLVLIYECENISLPDLLVDEEVERVLINVGNLTRCELNTHLIKQHLSMLHISNCVTLNQKSLSQVFTHSSSTAAPMTTNINAYNMHAIS